MARLIQRIVIVWLKQLSYALTNRDLRDAFLEGAPSPKIYQSCPYPQNITVRNLCYFWWAPTLVYQPVYPRSPTFRWTFFLKRVGETIALSIAIWFLSAQYAVPVLQNSVAAMGKLDVAVILERLMKLSTVSLIIWLAGFFALFQSGLNALAELLRFGDREFYTEYVSLLQTLTCLFLASQQHTYINPTPRKNPVGGTPARLAHIGKYAYHAYHSEKEKLNSS